MATPTNAARVAAYSSVSAHGRVAAADSHGLILMLLDGAVERISTARGCIERGDVAEKARLLHRAVLIIGELRASLDVAAGGQIAENLAALYDYVCRRLLSGAAENKIEPLDEVTKLLHEIRSAWVSIPVEARTK